MDQCRQNSMIVAAVAGGVVLLATWLVGGHPFAVALLLAVLAGGLLGSLLVWGVCSGRGSAAENEAVNATMWQPEPFTPSRRVVAPGGRVVSTRPLGGAVPEGLDAPALETVTLQATRDPATARLSATVSEPAAVQSAVDNEAVANRDVHSGVPTIGLPALEAPFAALADVPLPGSATFTDPLPPSEVDQARTDEVAHKAEKAQRKGAESALKVGPAAQDVVLGADRVATLTGEEVAIKEDGDDELLRIEGVDQMIAIWLRDSGVTSLAQIAAWDDADIARLAGMMGRNGHRIRREDWSGQAARLLGTRSAGGRRDG